MRFQKITIVGIGLLGGSIGLAARKRRVAREIAGYARREKTIVESEQAGALDYATTDLLAAVSGADLVILCTPLAQMRALTEKFLPALNRGAIVTDVGSVKASVIREICGPVRKAGAHFVGSHPMAGGEKSGVLASSAGLYDNALCVVTPTRNSNPAAVRKVEQFWKSLGAHTLRMDAGKHDLLVSRTSHLPHVVASALANLVLNPASPKDQAALCANGFRDTTRIASGSPEMWRDIATANRKNISQSVGALMVKLKKFQAALNKGDAKTIQKFFGTAKERRDNWCACCASPSPE